MTVAAIIQARMGSARLPGKVLTALRERPVLGWVVEAARAIPGVETVVVATSTVSDDDAVVAWCETNGIVVHRGSEEDVLERVAGAAEAVGASIVMRLTADCPLLDPQVCGSVLALLRRAGLDYANNTDPPEWPDGLDCEAMTRAALQTARVEARLQSEREHVTPFIRKRRARFRVGHVGCPLPDLTEQRWTLDDPVDLDFLRRLTELLPEGVSPPSYLDVLNVLETHPEIAANRESGPRGPSFADGTLDRCVRELIEAPRRFDRSNELLVRAGRVIPLASQTFSKSQLQFPVGRSPLYVSHGQGGRLFDVDGNEYVDLMSGLHPVLLGYRDPDVDRAIRDQLACGVSMSLSTELESELAERLVEIVPCAEMVRFGKNGSDVTGAAVRLARAFTGRDHIIACGYHGWQDWYIGATARYKGVPRAVRELTHRVPYNDLEAIRRVFATYPENVAAVIIEPMTSAEPALSYLDELKALVHRKGALLIFDEIITGFRFAIGGAQEYFGVLPDLAAFGKGMGNGMPISAVLGRADVLREMEEIFFSTTFGGETLSIAAAIAVLDKLKREPVVESLWRTGEQMAAAFETSVRQHGLDSIVTLRGKAPWKIIDIADHPNARADVVKTLFKREMLARGVLIGGGHNVNYAHHEADVQVVSEAYRQTFAVMAEELERGGVEDRIGCPVIQPVFAVRGGG